MNRLSGQGADGNPLCGPRVIGPRVIGPSRDSWTICGTWQRKSSQTLWRLLLQLAKKANQF